MVIRARTKSRSTRSKLAQASKRGRVARVAKTRSSARATSTRSLSLRAAGARGGARARTRATTLKRTTSRAGAKRGRVAGKMTLEEAGRKGGLARAQKYSKAQLSEQAKRGARTIERQSPGFHSRIGQKGGEARGRNR